MGEASTDDARAQQSQQLRWVPSDETPTRVFIARHGSTVHSLERRFSGRNELSLDEPGQAQALGLARHIRALGPIDAVISSPLRRARETAAAIADAVGVHVGVNDDLIETDFGQWEGLSFAEARDAWPYDMAKWLESGDVAPPDGESFAEVELRVRRAIASITASHAGQRVVFVSHVTPIKTLLRLALGAPEETMFRFHLDTASLSVVDYYADGGCSVRMLNNAEHPEP